MTQDIQICEYITIEEVASRISVNRKTVYNFIKKGIIPRELCLINGQDVTLPSLKKGTNVIKKESFEKWYKQQLEGMIDINQAKEKYGELITVERAAEIIGVTKRILMKKIDDRELRELYLINGEDYKDFRENQKYFFVLDKVNDYVEKIQETGLMSLEEAERKYGKLVHHNVVAQELKLDSDGFLKYLQEQNYLILEKDVHITGVSVGKRFITTKDYNELKDFFMQQKEKKNRLKKDKSLVLGDDVARWRGLDVDEFRLECKQGRMINAVADSVINTYGKREYFLKKEVLKNDEYQSTREIAEMLGVSASSINRLIADGKIKRPNYLKDTLMLNVEEVKGQIVNIQIENRKNMGNPTELKYFDFLSDETQALIEEYLEERQNMERFTAIDGVQFNRLKNEKTIEKNKSVLSNMFFKLTCMRSGLELKRNSKDLTEEYYQELDVDAFSVYDLKKSEVISLMKHYGVTKNDYSSILRPFLSWVFYKSELEMDEEDEREIRKVAKMKKTFRHFMELLPTRSKHNGRMKKKIFMNREQVVKTYKYIRSDPRTNKNFEYSLMWMIGVFAQIRPEEMIQLKIRDFELNQDGYLKEIDEEGYGKVWVEATRSKGGYSPSHPLYGTLLVPRLVKYINLYLKKLYQYQKPGTDGYLFRPFLHSPKVAYKTNSNGWVQRIRQTFDFIPSEDRSLFELKTSRRSANNIVRNYTDIKDPLLKGFQIRAAEVQMRHDIFKTGGRINDIYTQEISYEDYKKIIDEALNFPWDLDELKVWEMEKGYLSPHDVDVEKVEVVDNKEMLKEKKEKAIEDEKSTIQHKKKELEKLSAEFEKIKSKPNGMETVDWLKTRKKLKTQIDLLKRQL